MIIKYFTKKITFLLYIFNLLNHCISTEKTNRVYIVEKCFDYPCCYEYYNYEIVQPFTCKSVTGNVPFPDYMHFYMNIDLNLKSLELEFTHTKHLPARSFDGHYIQYLYINDPEVTTDENALEGAVHLTHFEVRRSNVKIIPNFSFVKNSISAIFIEESHLQSLDGENLQNLTYVLQLSFNKNEIRYIDPDVFKGTEDVWLLDLSNNYIMYIPQQLLDPMKDLMLFKANFNNLLHVGNLFSIVHPQGIYLQSNNISDIGSLLKKMLFEKNLTPEMRRCINEMDSRMVIIPIFGLEVLDLSFNSINETSQPMFPCYEMLQENRNLVFVYFTGIKELILTGNELRNFGSLLKHFIIHELKVNKNKIHYLTVEDFESTRDISKLELQENKITRIDTETFKEIRDTLQELDLSSNLLKSLNGSVRYLFKLEVLKLSYNLIQSFIVDEFLGVNLSELHLGHNRIKSTEFLQHLTYLQYLDITNNYIELISTQDMPPNLKKMDFAGNPFQCNCRFQQFLQHLNGRYNSADVDICLKHNFGDGEHCPSTCACGCTNISDFPFISVNCSSKHLSVIPQLFRSNLTGKSITALRWRPFKITLNIYSIFHIKDDVLGIDLENNNLQSLEQIQLPLNLVHLKLANNKLRRLPDFIYILNLKEITLGGNPWICDCGTVNFRKWLRFKRRTIQDIDNVLCGPSDNMPSNLLGRVLWNVTEFELCPPDVSLTVSISSGILCFLVLCYAEVLVYTKYKFNINVFLYSYGFTFVKEKDFDSDKEFDAFMSFSHEDGEFVTNEIIKVIEDKDPSVRLFVHYRDFRAGELIYNNIVRAVHCSKRTVLILSEHFLESEWCMAEFRIALMKSLEDKVNRIIIIKSGDLPEAIDPAIKAHLNSTTYLTWGERHFWRKLLYVLPNGNCEGKLL